MSIYLIIGAAHADQLTIKTGALQALLPSTTGSLLHIQHMTGIMDLFFILFIYF
jgi:hypothetical protein